MNLINIKLVLAIISSLIFSIYCNNDGTNETNKQNDNADGLANFGQDTGRYGSVNIGAEYNPVKLTAGMKTNF
jgi:hypothetical protein